MQHNDFDVLPAHINDAMRIGMKAQRRLGMGHGLDQRHIGVQHIAQDILGIAGGADTKHFETRSLDSTCWRRDSNNSFVSSMGLP